jgi:hypothetical protein
MAGGYSLFYPPMRLRKLEVSFLFRLAASPASGWGKQRIAEQQNIEPQPATSSLRQAQGLSPSKAAVSNFEGWNRCALFLKSIKIDRSTQSFDP